MSTTQDTLHQLKIQAAKQALEFVKTGEILGIGSGSTVNCLIELLPEIRSKIKACVSSSNYSTSLLKKHGFEVLDLNNVDEFSVYIDGADESNSNLELIKGGGAALTREKIVCAHAKTFVCIIDQTKKVEVLGKFALPLEVIPMAAQYVMRQMHKIGGTARIRTLINGDNLITDNSNWIIDVLDLKIHNPIELEIYLDGIAGIVANGLFAKRGADHLIIANVNGIEIIERGLD
ncbi:ribose 5-phosphate isomerase constitutive [Gammaproteobacteria bacterium]|nr:ribose 5-phosphate isomerase constitutive [Gammaproteobacteria bacterium]